MSGRTRYCHGPGLGRYPPDSGKQGYCPDLQLNDDHPCIPWPTVFDAPNGIWSESGSANPIEREGWIRQLAGEQTHTGTDESSQTSQENLNRLSGREYSLRVGDPNDFASVWEASVVPVLVSLLQRYCGTSDFAVDVHNFPEMSSDAIPRVIYITLTDHVDASLEEIVRTELGKIVPARFNPLYLKFRKGSMRKLTSWWGQEEGESDDVCEPRNVVYRPTPIMGMSIGPVGVQDAGSLGGFIKVGHCTYAMSAAHVFSGDSIHLDHVRVNHPAEPDLPLITPEDRDKQYEIGTVTMGANPGKLRPSITFQNLGLTPDQTLVEMDYCLIGPVTNGKNIVSIPSYRMDRHASVETIAAVEGNTEVYGVSRTSGYSLGFTSDIPGLQHISGSLRREWTVRQYSPFKHPGDSGLEAPWQTLKQWVTSGIGVPGDSGAWIMRRRDNALLGLVWGRNYDRRDPLEYVRLTYFTPIVDIVVDVEESHAQGQEVVLPTYSDLELTRTVESQRDVVQFEMFHDPWNPLSRGPIQECRQNQRDMVRRRFLDGNILASTLSPSHQQQLDSASNLPVPSNWQDPSYRYPSVLSSGWQTTPLRSEGDGCMVDWCLQDQLILGMDFDCMPGLSVNAPSIRSSSGSVIEPSEIVSVGKGVHILGEESAPEDMPNIDEPVRSKARFGPKTSAFTKRDFVPGETRALR